MKFSYLALALDDISKMNSRNTITNMLSKIFSQSTPEEARIISYLITGHLRAVYLSTQFNLGQKTILKIVSEFLAISIDKVTDLFHKIGDIGILIKEHDAKDLIFNDKDLTIEQVYEKLVEIEQISGQRSQEIKAERLLSLLRNLDSISASLVINIILDKMRLGFSDMTILDSFSIMIANDKSLKKTIEYAYNIRADIGLIAYDIKKYGIERLKELEPKIGIPIRPAAAERAKSAEDIIKRLGSPCVAQPKLDGFRLQVHFKSVNGKPEVKFFSRNLNNMTSMFPDLTQAFSKCSSKEVILEGEAISYDEQTGDFLSFQHTIKRRRKHNIEKAVSEHPLRLYLFDILKVGKTNVMGYEYTDRRKLLVDIFGDPSNLKVNNIQGKDSNESSDECSKVKVIEEVYCYSSKDLREYFNLEISKGAEGIVAKNINAIYTPGKRSSNWIKLKRVQQGELNDTIDVVVLGYYYGRGRRAEFGIGAFLVGIYNKSLDMYQSITKVGTGLTDKQWIELKSKISKYEVSEKPNNVQVSPELYPPVWVKPEIVIEITADEITKSPLHLAGIENIGDNNVKSQGFALRFPRFLKFRIDKSPEQTTTVNEINNLYNQQLNN